MRHRNHIISLGLLMLAALCIGVPATASASSTSVRDASNPVEIQFDDGHTSTVLLVRPYSVQGLDISGDGQIGVSGRTIGKSLQVLVTNERGHPVAGVPVMARLIKNPENGGEPPRLSIDRVVSDASGLCRFDLRLSNTEGWHAVYFYISGKDDTQAGITYNVRGMGENWASWMLFNLLGGLAIFLFGMKITSEGLQSVGARHLRNIMARLTSDPFSSMGVGAAATFATQSSSASTSMLVSFVHSGVMSFRQTLPVILGAAVGTTITVQLISFNVQKFALPLIFVGFSIMFFSKEKKWRGIGNTLLGFGIIFFGMKVMSDSVAPLRSLSTFKDAIQILGDHPIWGTVFAAAFTALVQSSGAVLGVAISIAGHGAMDLKQAMPIIYGANIGTCVTAMLASIGMSSDAKRVAWAHLLFKVIGVAGFFLITPVLVYIGMQFSILLGEGDNVARQIANTHTIFNMLLAIIFLPILGLLEKATCYIVKDEVVVDQHRVKYIDKSLIDAAPELVLGACLREISRMGGFVEGMLKSISKAIFQKEEDAIDFVHRRDDKVDRLMGTLLQFLNDVDKKALDPGEAERVQNLMFVVNDMENIGDIIDKNLAPIARKIINRDMDFSKEGRQELEIFFNQIVHELSTVIIALTTSDTELAVQVIRHWDGINEEKHKLMLHHLERLRQGLPETIETSSIHLDLINYLMRIEYYVYQMARVVYGEYPTTSSTSSHSSTQEKSLESE